jgi:hypothetical protein
MQLYSQGCRNPRNKYSNDDKSWFVYQFENFFDVIFNTSSDIPFGKSIAFLARLSHLAKPDSCKRPEFSGFQLSSTVP